jgi:hypothetical protein
MLQMELATALGILDLTTDESDALAVQLCSPQDRVGWGSAEPVVSLARSHTPAHGRGQWSLLICAASDASRPGVIKKQ